MKKTLITFLFLLSKLISGQTYADIEKISAYINQPLSKFEKEQNMKPTDGAMKKFGLTTCVYNYQNFVVVMSEVEENGVIGDISFMPKRDINSSEKWYNICKQMDNSPEYIFEGSLMGSENSEIREEQLKFNSLIDKLRKFNDVSDFIYYVKYKKNSLYYQLSIVKEKMLIRVKNKSN